MGRRTPQISRAKCKGAIANDKLISPNNVSSARITDYEVSIQWLRDASKLRINPQIARKLDENKKPITDWQLATFQRDYNPYENPWLT